MCLQLNNSCKGRGSYQMSQKEDLVNRLKAKPKNFTIGELNSLMHKCGYEKYNRGRTSGSAISYYHTATKKILKIHSPHPRKELKPYMIEKVLIFLKETGEI